MRVKTHSLPIKSSLRRRPVIPRDNLSTVCWGRGPEKPARIQVPPTLLNSHAIRLRRVREKERSIIMISK